MKSVSRICGVELNSTAEQPRQLHIGFYGAVCCVCTATIRYLGSDGKPLTNHSAGKNSSMSRSVLIQNLGSQKLIVPQPIRSRVGTVKAYGSVVVWLCESLLYRCEKIRLTLDIETNGSSRVLSLIMERRKCDMSLGVTPASQYGFPISEAEIEARVNWLFDQYPFLSRDSGAASDGATKLWLSLRGGYDSPLLDFPTKSDPLNRTVHGSVKNAGLQLHRDRKTSFGLGRNGRRVTRGESLDSIRDFRAEDSGGDPEADRAQQRALVECQINAFTSNSVYRQLIVRRLFGDEQIVDLAQELRIGYPNARSIVHRARRFLGLK